MRAEGETVSDGLAGILMVADYLSRQRVRQGRNRW
jgi:hypothetical protein